MTTVTSPLAGRAIGLAAVPDPVFSGAMVGPGTAIDPVREAGEAVSPWTESSSRCTHMRSSWSTVRGTEC